MKKSSINIKRFLPHILLIIVNIGIGLGVAKATGLLAQVELGRNAKSTLSCASLLKSLNGVRTAGLLQVGLQENAVKDLVSKVEVKDSLGALASHLLG